MSSASGSSNEERRTDTNADEKQGVGWVHYLKKKQVISELKQRNVQVDESQSIDQLRKLLADAVRATKSEEHKSVRQGSNSKVGDSSKSETTADDDEIVTSDSKESEESMAEFKLQFCLKTDDWDIFIDRLEAYFTARDVKEDKKAATLLTKLDEEAYILIKNLCAPDKPIGKTYEALQSYCPNIFIQNRRKSWRDVFSIKRDKLVPSQSPNWQRSLRGYRSIAILRT